ncbi:tryptophan synthase subunit alpha [Bacillus paralicheniformis]|jgi:tryptophan synthase alpha chain|uniref:Tryptophan synthase alpha chain n=1 Tax=Bacillus paralicheniformis TaxID=1648923 RepID=A0A6I7TT91_9BACI|nr:MULTISPECIES: tryptophan synthase subunit alpha [Bacillus]KJD53380.1 tryptophan synthase subunit alpha [Bacillus amyloliquefaciens]KUL06885.1 tryptophan synthase subunit alpha [Bacillus licheniformis LMG 7559]KUL18800.1 tryptophan synthase subunit alpha [Bacillus licheniformis LMG 6934]AGN36834.1 tryptophan synthase alpha subunit TrpA [Bacillus paralicheniformis ATCC 9945a]AYQ16821.1 tryptophan synthase subunit alpha [Bacillus paralicheniformis]
MFNLKKQPSDKLFVPFITAGDPLPEISIELAKSLQEAGASALELGVPYSDPLADGPVIQRASKRALDNDMNIVKAIRLGGEMKKNGVHIPIILFTYYNPVLQLDTDHFFALLRQNRLDGLLIPDLPFEESVYLQQQCKKHGITYISLVAPTSESRIQKITQQAEGFVYCVSSLGVTGVRNEFEDSVSSFIRSVKGMSSVPVAVGFGISSSKQVEMMNELADGVVVGSALVRKIEELKDELIAPETREQALKAFEAYAKTFSGSYMVK